MYGNGAGTGMVIAYQATRQMQARLRALTAVNAVVLGVIARTTRRLTAGTATTRPSATTAMASV